MIKKSLFCIILSFLLIFTPPISVAAVSTDALTLSARSAILIDGEENAILYAKNERQRLPMASTTKIMTAIVCAELLELDTVLTVPREAVGVEGSSIYLCEGEMLTVEELLYALLLESANDAALTIAIRAAGSVENFAQKCNEKADSLLLRDTSFKNPHGLHEEGHYTTAHDLAIICSAALKDPRLRAILSAKKMTISLGKTKENPNGNGIRYLKNHNKMLSLYEGAIGGKTGFTKKSGRCLVSCAKRDGMTLIAVTLNAPNDWQDHTLMLDFGFETFEYRTFFEAREFIFDFPVTNAESDVVTLTNVAPIRAVVPKSQRDFTQSVESTLHFAFAPIEKGQVLGELKITVLGKQRSSLLVAISDTNEKKARKFFSKFFANADLIYKN